jgi:hypothetical protein
MTDGHRARAELNLALPDEGGLSTALPSGTRSLLLRFAGFEGNQDSLPIGAVITTTKGEALEPGDRKVEADLHFWADEARIHATPGAHFELWYRRAVGTGMILNVVADLDA